MVYGEFYEMRFARYGDVQYLFPSSYEILPTLVIEVGVAYPYYRWNCLVLQWRCE